MKSLAIWLGTALVACTPNAREMQFTQATELSAPTDVGAAPMLALGPRGERTVAWVSAPGGGSDGRLYVSTNGGVVHEFRDSVGGIEPHGEAPPKLGYDREGRLYALYAVGKLMEGRRFPFTTLRLATSHDGGETWSDPRTVTADSVLRSRNFHALHVAADGSIYVAWLESGTAGQSGTYITRSTDNGTSWTQSVRVDAAESCPCCRTAIATAPDGTLYLSWRTVMPGQVRDIVVARSGDHGATWSTPVRVHADNFVFEGCPHAGPSMQVDAGGRLHIMWWTGREKAAGVYYARSDDGGESFEHVIPMGVAEFARPAHVQLTLGAENTVYATWDDARSALPRVVVRTSDDGGNAFDGPIILSDTAVAATFPVVGFADQTLTIAWAQQSEADLALAVQARPDMSDPTHSMPLPTVGRQSIFVRTALFKE